MTHCTTTLSKPDLSGFAPMAGTAIAMLGMLILLAVSAVPMML